MKRKDRRMYPEDAGAVLSGSKRIRHVLTVQQKVDVLRKIDRGVSTSSGVWCWAIYKNVPVSQTLTDSEIIDAVPGRKLNESEDSADSSGSVDEENKMTMAEAISCCDNLINFME
jgi:hypothetical protein